MSARRNYIRVNALAQAHLVRLLLDGDVTCHDLAEEAGLHYVTVLQYVRALRKVGVVYVARWLPDALGRHTTMVLRLGKGKDAPRVRATKSEKMKQYHKRQRDAKLLGLTRSEPCQR